MLSSDPAETRYGINERGAAVAVRAMHATRHLSRGVHIWKACPAIRIDFQTTDSIV
jgi:hypothetical protein